MSKLVNKVDPFGDGSGITLWQFEGNANDTGGNYNGTWHGTEQYDTGKFGQAAKFDGSSYIRFNSTIITGSNDFTFSCFAQINTTPNASVKQYIFSCGRDATNSACALCFGDPGIKLIQFNYDYYFDNSSFSLNTLYHIVLVRKGSSFLLHMNSNYISSLTANANIGNENNMVFGAWGVRNNPSEYLNGLIDQVRIFNRALTAEEVSYLYKEIKPSKSFARSNTF